MPSPAEQPLIFYDGTCGMCHGVVRFLLKHDHQRIFLFAPLQGETAAKILKAPFDPETIVLVEEGHFWTQGKAVFRILWLLGGIWKLPGALFFLPAFLYNWGYRWIAKRRFQWFKRPDCPVPQTDDLSRFLP